MSEYDPSGMFTVLEQAVIVGLVGVIAGTARLTREAIGAIHIQPKQTYVDVAGEHVKLVLKKLNGISFKGRKLVVAQASS